MPLMRAAALDNPATVTARRSTAPGDPPSADDDGYRDLINRAREAGFFHCARWRRVLRTVLLGILYVSGWVAVFVLGRSWYQLVVAAYLAVVFSHVAFLGHDVGHRQVSRSRRLNRALGLACGNLGTGVSYSYWVDKHNQHHARPNQVGSDPDIGPGVISWTTEQVSAKTGLNNAIARHQAALFFPLTLLEALNLHVASVRALRAQGARRARTEAIFLFAHAAAYLSAVCLAMPALQAVAFIAVQQGIFGFYLGCAFAPNHKGMPMLPPGSLLSFARRQILTSRNVKGGRALALALGGLNYQIEHHLFPTMPMANLRKCRPMVRAYCSSHGLDYCETSLVGSYIAGLRHLGRVSRTRCDNDRSGLGTPAGD